MQGIPALTGFLFATKEALLEIFILVMHGLWN